MSARAILALGSNLGERAETLAEAVQDLVESPEVRMINVSPVVQTEAVGGPEGQPPYLNMVLEIETELGPYELLELCHAVEAKHHRVRLVRFGPRTLDVDVIDYAGMISDDPVLTLPHPRAAERAFVLVPWLLMNPQAALSGIPVRDLVREAPDLAGVQDFDGFPLERVHPAAARVPWKDTETLA
ncbi:2-amino-4-hydroxy-6-hydroxymethyldihydropteridine diphosphokinase [Psychromicrobium xiongbiense]|uniref:2-amino-4-hydroxy-6- hydroxymethyldihydropteridine diphosphokinase n=1 Tax=Psychromicrobium xiongbiense TaxID=3051184 RepID=UPI00255735C4|nr:2-amino-4-hydroxy-6-hydroxymethyldihydropteridine diphosphokinase [Psychromicrobium sp. YIM S02556]